MKESMQDSKLYYALSQLEPEELSDFIAYAASPFLNKDQILEKFLRLFDERVLKSESGQVNRMDFFAEFYPGKKYNANRLRKLMTALLNLLMEFVEYNEYKRDSLARKKKLLQFYNKRGWQKLFPRAYKEALREAENEVEHDVDHLRYLFEFKNENLIHQSRQPGGIKPSDMFHLVESLDTWFIALKMKYVCAVLEFKKFPDGDVGLDLVDVLLEHIQEHEETMPPLVRAWYFVYLTLTEPEDTDAYYQLKELLYTEGGRLSEEEAHDLYDCALNYSIRSMNRGMADFRNETLELYERVLDNGIILEAGELSFRNYQNIAEIMLRSGEKEWAWNFIETYADLIRGDTKKVAVKYNHAVWYFWDHQYRKAARLFNEVLGQGTDQGSSVEVRMFLWKSWYELGEYDLLESDWHAFRNFLRRNEQISEKLRTALRNFLRMFSRLVRIMLGNPDKRKQSLEKLQRELNENKQTANRQWLNWKIQEGISAA